MLTRRYNASRLAANAARMVGCIGLITASTLITFGQATNSPENAGFVAVKVTLSTDKRIYKIGEIVLVTYAIRNVGSEPVYIPKQTTLIASPWGGFEIKVRSPSNAKAIGEGSSADAGLDSRKRDTLANLAENWLVLYPGQFYGETSELPFRPLTPGKYQLVAEHFCESLTNAELRVLEKDHTVLQGRRRSDPVRIVFVK